MDKEPTVPRSDPPLDGLSFSNQLKAMGTLLDKQSESDKEEGFQGNLGSLVCTLLEKQSESDKEEGLQGNLGSLVDAKQNTQNKSTGVSTRIPNAIATTSYNCCLVALLRPSVSFGSTRRRVAMSFNSACV